MNRSLFFCLCILLAGCPKSTPQDGGVVPDAPMGDAGPEPDGGPVADGGPGSDGGPGADATPEAGGSDTIAPVDVGTPDAPTPDVIIDAGPPVMVEMVDLLFVVDNSGSMSQEQESLAVEMPVLMQALSSGRTPDGTTFPPITDLRVGFVTTDMGIGGYVIPTCSEPNFGDDGIMYRDSDCGNPAGVPPYVGFRAGDDPGDVARSLSCLANLGTEGCGFEQQLDAMLKSITPASSPTNFVNGTVGHGDGANESFLRDESLLVVVIVTDEDDCSAANPDLFNRDSATFPDPDLNLRCARYGDPSLGAVHPVSRYVDGLLAVHPPERTVFHLVAGLPVDLAPAVGTSPDYELLIGDPSVRDPRMIVEPDPARPTQLRTSCEVPGRGVAFPPVRLISVAQGLERRGAGVVVQSICQGSFGLALALTDRIARHL